MSKYIRNEKIILTITILAQTVISLAQEMPWFMEYQKGPSYKGQVKEIKEYYPIISEEPELQDTDYYFYTRQIRNYLLNTQMIKRYI